MSAWGLTSPQEWDQVEADEAYQAHLDEQQQRAYEAHCREAEDREAAQHG